MLNFLFYLLCGITVIFFVIPIAVFLIVRIGTYAFYKGRKQFHEEEKNNE